MFVATDRGPPDVEFVGLVNHLDWKATESIEEAEERRNKPKRDDSSYRVSPELHWRYLESMKAHEKADKLLKTIMN